MMFLYHLRLAIKSIRRNPVLSAVMVVSLAIGISVWAASRAGLAGARKNPLPDVTALYQVKIDRPPFVIDVLDGPRYRDIESFSQGYVSVPEAAALDASGAGSPHSAAMDARVVLTTPDGTLHRTTATAAGRDLFTMFSLRFARGGPWSAEAEAGRAREVVLDEAVARSLLGSDDVVGRSISVNGTPHTISGTLRHGQAKGYASAFLRNRLAEDVFLPLAAARPLGLWPAFNFLAGDPPASLDELYASDNAFLFYWVWLPDAAAVERFLAGAAARGAHAHVVPFAEAFTIINYVHPAYPLLYLFAHIALVAAALNLLRLLLAKFTARASETGIHRAMGASRGSIVAQHVLEATLIGLGGGVLGLIIAAGDIAFMNAAVPDRPGDAVLDGLAVLVTVALAAIIGALAGCYSAWRATRLPPALFLGRA